MNKGISLSVVALLFSMNPVNAESNIAQVQVKCSEYIGTDKTDKQLKNNLKSGEHKVSAAHSLGKILGNSMRRKSYETWAAGFLSGYEISSGKSASVHSSDKIKAGLLAYCSQHADATLLDASKAVAQKSQ